VRLQVVRPVVKSAKLVVKLVSESDGADGAGAGRAVRWRWRCATTGISKKARSKASKASKATRKWEWLMEQTLVGGADVARLQASNGSSKVSKASIKSVDGADACWPYDGADVARLHAPCHTSAAVKKG
jgi:hypothetical protein